MASEDIYTHDPTPDTATAALNTLFAQGNQYEHLDLAIDPSLETGAENGGDGTGAGEGGPNGEGGNDSGVGDRNDGAPHEVNQENGSGAGDHADGSRHASATGTPGDDDQGADGDANAAADGAAGGAKRKATSRINMLPRGGACEFCKRRKLKCTAEQPQCRACARSGRECVYSQKQQRSRVRVLEDKLLELEQRLDKERQANAGNTGGGPATVPAVISNSPNALAPPSAAWIGSSTGSIAADMSSTTSPVHPTPMHFLGGDAIPSTAPSAGMELFLGLGADAFNLADVQFLNKGREPDLMTLADAAAGDSNGIASWPWEGMTPADVASELYKTVIENHKGIGEKIVAHLLQSFARPPHIRDVHGLVDPVYFFDRLTGARGPPPHPSLVAALIPNVLCISPSPTLSNREVILAACDALYPSSRSLSQHALSNLDSRVIDLVVAATLRCEGLTASGRFVDGWNENSMAVGLVWATGIGKLGNVMEEFVPIEHRPADRAARHSREQRVRIIRSKGTICPVPSDITECVHRINIFWYIYLVDRANGIGWNWPAAMDASEITTPLPRDSYNTPADLVDCTTIDDFMSGRVMGSASDSCLCLLVKAVTILYEASRLLDKAPEVATPDKTAHLLRISKRLMTTIRPFSPTNREDAIQLSEVSSVWMTMHTAMMLLHGRDEVDAASPEEAAEACDKGIEAALKMCDGLEVAIAAGDTELTGYGLMAASVWCITGRSMHHYAQRIKTSDPAKSQLLRRKIQMLIEASRASSSSLRLAEVYTQMLLNITLGAEAMLGEYERPDNIEFLTGTPHYSPV